MYCLGWYFLREINCKQDFIVRDGPLFFWRGAEGSKIFTWKHFFFAAPAAKNWFCVSFLLKILFLYLHTIYFSVYSLCKQFISKFSNPSPPPPPSKNNGPSLMAKKKKSLLCQINVIWYDYPLHSRDSLKNRAPARKKRVITAWPAAFEGGYSAAWTERRGIIN